MHINNKILGPFYEKLFAFVFSNFCCQSVVNGDSTGVLKALMSLTETIVKLKTSFLRIYGR